jgi:hypothetical protein
MENRKSHLIDRGIVVARLDFLSKNLSLKSFRDSVARFLNYCKFGKIPEKSLFDSCDDMQHKSIRLILVDIIEINNNFKQGGNIPSLKECTLNIILNLIKEFQIN